MATYHEVKKQIAALEAKAELLRKAEAARIIKTMKSQIAKYGLRISDLFDDVVTIESAPVAVAPVSAPKAARAPAKKAKVLKPKYMDPVTKKTWSGFGKPPGWIKNGKRESFLIGVVQEEKVVAKVAPKVAPAKKKAAVVKAVKAPAVKVAPKKAAVAEQATKKPVAPKVPAKKAPVTKPVAKIPAVKKAAPALPKAKKVPAKVAPTAPVVKEQTPVAIVEVPAVVPAASTEQA